jgi:hypothetical protein
MALLRVANDIQCAAGQLSGSSLLSPGFFSSGMTRPNLYRDGNVLTQMTHWRALPAVARSRVRSLSVVKSASNRVWMI